MRTHVLANAVTEYWSILEESGEPHNAKVPVQLPTGIIEPRAKRRRPVPSNLEDVVSQLPTAVPRSSGEQAVS